MKVRWLVKRRHITADMVRKYSEQYSVSLLIAKQELERDNTGQELQYRTWYGKWVPVPFDTEYFE